MLALNGVIVDTLALRGSVAEEELVGGAGILAPALTLLLSGKHQLLLMARTLREREIAGSILRNLNL